MIRKITLADYDKIAEIWLTTSLKTHDFIEENYWREMLPSVKNKYLPMAETYVLEDKHQIKGFISLLKDNYVGALFVKSDLVRKKIGSKLLRYVRRNRPNMSLRVFTKNKNALKFYQQSGFKIVAENTEDSTQEEEVLMAWARGCKSGDKKAYLGDS